MQLHLDTNKRELKSHGTYEFPVHVSYEQLSRYERKSFLWHWHKEIELTILLQGEMNYQINDTIYHLHEGEGLFCNSNILHTGSSCNNSDCIYISTTFHPRFLYGYENSILQTKYVNTITDNASLAGFLLSPDISWQKGILDELTAIWEYSVCPSSSYEMQLHQMLSKIWLILWENALSIAILILTGFAAIAYIGMDIVRQNQKVNLFITLMADMLFMALVLFKLPAYRLAGITIVRISANVQKILTGLL